MGTSVAAGGSFDVVGLGMVKRLAAGIGNRLAAGVVGQLVEIGTAVPPVAFGREVVGRSVAVLVTGERVGTDCSLRGVV